MTKRTFRFHAEAARELEESALWYEERQPGLGARFLDAVDDRLQDIAARPQRWRVVRGARRAPLRRFPFAIVFRIDTDGQIQVVAVAHSSRRPGFWASR